MPNNSYYYFYPYCYSYSCSSDMFNFSKNKLGSSSLIKLTPSVRAPPGRGGHSNQLMYGPPRAGGVTSCCRFCTSDVKMFWFVASFH